MFVDEGATVKREMDIAPGPPVLVGMKPETAFQLDFEHPHEVFHLVADQIDQGLPVGGVRAKHLAAQSFGGDHGPNVTGQLMQTRRSWANSVHALKKIGDTRWPEVVSNTAGYELPYRQ